MLRNRFAAPLLLVIFLAIIAVVLWQLSEDEGAERIDQGVGATDDGHSHDRIRREDSGTSVAVEQELEITLLYDGAFPLHRVELRLAGMDAALVVRPRSRDGWGTARVSTEGVSAQVLELKAFVDETEVPVVIDRTSLGAAAGSGPKLTIWMQDREPTSSKGYIWSFPDLVPVAEARAVWIDVYHLSSRVESGYQARSVRDGEPKLQRPDLTLVLPNSGRVQAPRIVAPEDLLVARSREQEVYGVWRAHENDLVDSVMTYASPMPMEKQAAVRIVSDIGASPDDAVVSLDISVAPPFDEFFISGPRGGATRVLPACNRVRGALFVLRDHVPARVVLRQDALTRGNASIVPGWPPEVLLSAGRELSVELLRDDYGTSTDPDAAIVTMMHDGISLSVPCQVPGTVVMRGAPTRAKSVSFRVEHPRWEIPWDEDAARLQRSWGTEVSLPDGAEQAVRLVLSQKRRLAGVVTDPSGAAIPDVEIVAFASEFANAAPGQIPPAFRWTTVSDSTGAFLFENVTSSSVEIVPGSREWALKDEARLQTPGYSTEMANAIASRTSGSESVLNLRVVVERAASVEGQVLDSDGLPVVGALVGYTSAIPGAVAMSRRALGQFPAPTHPPGTPWESARKTTFPGPYTFTDADGSFELVGIVPQQAAVIEVDGGRGRSRTLTMALNPGEKKVITITLSTPKPIVLRFDVRGITDPPVSLRAFSVDRIGIPLGPSNPGYHESVQEIPSDGRVVLEGFSEPAKVSLALRSSGPRVVFEKSGESTVRLQQVVDDEAIVLARFTTLNGIMTGLHDRAALIFVSPAVTHGITRTFSSAVNREGRFSIEVPSEGVYRITGLRLDDAFLGPEAVADALSAVELSTTTPLNTLSVN